MHQPKPEVKPLFGDKLKQVISAENKLLNFNDAIWQKQYSLSFQRGGKENNLLATLHLKANLIDSIKPTGMWNKGSVFRTKKFKGRRQTTELHKEMDRIREFLGSLIYQNTDTVPFGPIDYR